MSKNMMAWFLAQLKVTSLGITQVEPYEGQFEDMEDVSIFPPAAFVMVGQFESKREAAPAILHCSVSVYLVTNHIHGNTSDSILDLMDSVITALHDKPVRYETDDTVSVPPDAYLGRCFLEKGEFLGILPGMAAYKLNFIVKRK